jgi:hypothetical protein
MDLGRFITAIIVVTGFAFPIVLAHSEIIRVGACVMSIVGGGYVVSFVRQSLLLKRATQVGLWHDFGIHSRI